jgi:hypothetical protein
MTTSDGGPAFPNSKGTRQIIASSHESDRALEIVATGLSIRDWFAGYALQGMLASDELCEILDGEQDYDARPIAAARRAYQYADAMLKARQQ